MTTTDTICCPGCGRPNDDALADGAVEGPREYHAGCWRAASAAMSADQVAAAWLESTIDDESA